MQKYKTYEVIDKKDMNYFNGLSNEILTYIFYKNKNLPLLISAFGVTFPDKEYHIKRNNSQYFILEYVVSGKGTVKVNSKKFEVEKNDVYLLEPGSYHEYYADKVDPYKKYWVNFSSSTFMDIIKSYGLNDIHVFKNCDCSEEFVKIFNLEKVSTYNDDIYAEASSIIFSILMKLKKLNIEKPKESDLAIQIRNRFDDAIYSQIQIEDICKELGISRSTLIREFNKYFDCTPHEYLLNKKINMAKSLLSTTRYSIKSISDLLDFADEHYFSNIFKRKVGFTPSQFRLKKSHINND